MPNANSYPPSYRAREVAQLLQATQAGECAAVNGLSGVGKSNVLRALAERHASAPHPHLLADWNRLAAPTAPALFDLLRRTLGDQTEATDPLAALETALRAKLNTPDARLTLLLDRSDALAATTLHSPQIFGNLRALRDTFKYQLTYIIAARRPLDAHNELAELFFGNTLWLGPLSEEDAEWTVRRYLARKLLQWPEKTIRQLREMTRAYPSFLRAACEAHAAGCALTEEALATHPVMQARLREFWEDAPTAQELQLSGLSGLPLLNAARPASAPPVNFDTSKLTAKEKLLLDYFLQHAERVCEKDTLIRAAWPEDKVFVQGVRDDSLAQLIRRLREKIEPDPAQPRHILTLPGRGYKFTP